ncbi:MAG: S46 family peptidase [Flavobacteriales bacterium]|nr:S46 family peptidase [Flavobacteriales bacterium]
MNKIIVASLVLIFSASGLKANEGMWMLNMLKKINEAEMQGLGLKLSADDIYNINRSSVKDAIGRMNYGMCTVEMISAEGLTLTNHHCAFNAIQSHSSVENDYLTDGFWAKTKAEELPIEGMVVSYLVRIDDVSDRISSQLSPEMSEDERGTKVRELSTSIKQEMMEGNQYEVDVKSFFGGNEFYAFTYITYTDVRLVGAPPSSIGKFGGDTDNWMWPRHTGDFSLLRVYADKDGNPAPYSEENVPHKPKHFLPISLDGVSEGDFAMILGYPGSTDRYLSSFGVKMALEIDQPARVKIRGEKLRLMKEDMDASDEVRIKYASKYAGVSNYWKYFQGQMRGLKRLKVYEKKQTLEDDFLAWANGDMNRKSKYGNAIASLQEGYAGVEKFKLAETYLQEAAFGSEILVLAYRAGQLDAALQGEDQQMIEGTKAALMERAKSHFKDYNQSTDLKVTARMMEMYAEAISPEFQPEFMIKAGGKNADWEKWTKKMFSKSVFASESSLNSFLADPSAKKLAKDPAMNAINQFLNIYRGKIGAGAGPYYSMTEKGYRQLIAGLREMNPDKKYYPNANSTMRLTYGTVGDYIPADGMKYDYVTTTDGILEKEDPSNDEFIVPAYLKELIQKEQFGEYADENGDMIVCFISNNDITGGNSGSPVINGKGELIGLAFDGNWEAMSGDIAFEPELQRTISVDVRYVLFVIDKYAGAKHLIEEMKLVKAPAVKDVSSEVQILMN